MKNLFKFDDLHFDREVVAITILSTLLLLVDFYQRLTPRKEIDRVALYLLVPLLVILLAFRKSPREFGFQLGDWKAGLAITAIFIVIAAPLLWFVVRGDAFYGQLLQRPVERRRTYLDLPGPDRLGVLLPRFPALRIRSPFRRQRLVAAIRSLRHGPRRQARR